MFVSSSTRRPGRPRKTDEEEKCEKPDNAKVGSNVLPFPMDGYTEDPTVLSGQSPTSSPPPQPLPIQVSLAALSQSKLQRRRKKLHELTDRIAKLRRHVESLTVQSDESKLPRQAILLCLDNVIRKLEEEERDEVAMGSGSVRGKGKGREIDLMAEIDEVKGMKDMKERLNHAAGGLDALVAYLSAPAPS